MPYVTPSYIEQRFSRGKQICFWERGHFRRGIYAPTHLRPFIYLLLNEITSAGCSPEKKIIASPEISAKKNGTLKKWFFVVPRDFFRAFYSSSPP